MTRKRSVEMVVMRKNIQNSQRSTFFISKWERTPRRANDRAIHIRLFKKNEKDWPSRQAFSTLAGCGRPEPEISRHWISFRRKRNFGQNLILLLPAYLPFPRGPWPPAPGRPPPPAALFWGKLYQTRFWSFDPLRHINFVPPRFCRDFRTCLLPRQLFHCWLRRKGGPPDRFN